MTDIRFYQLSRKKIEQALPEIAQKGLERGHRVLVRARDAGRVEALDAALWTFDPASFLPHGAALDGSEGEQPVFIADRDINPNRADMLIMAEGAVVQDLSPFTLVCEIFDATDEETVLAARQRWTRYKDAGHDLSYYAQDDGGRWVKKQ